MVGMIQKKIMQVEMSTKRKETTKQKTYSAHPLSGVVPLNLGGVTLRLQVGVLFLISLLH